MKRHGLTILAILLGVYIALSPRGAEGAEDADVLFEFNEAELTPKGEEVLAETADELRGEAEGGTVAIDGHADGIGSDSYNQSLSERRAEAVEEFLARRLEDAEFESAGHGSSDPVASEELGGWDNPLGRAKNRRVEITVVG